MELDDEIKGKGNSYAYTDRSYDPRIGRWWSTDAYSTIFASHSPYAFALNNPIYLIDEEGEYPKPSELLAKFGVELPPLAAGILDGAVDQVAGIPGLIYDITFDPEFRHQLVETVKAIAADPIAAVGEIANEYIERIDRLAAGDGTNADYYFAGEELGGAVAGVLLGGTTLAVKYGKKLLTKPKGKVARLTKKIVDDPFGGDGKLKKSVKYKQGEFGYLGETDDIGRVSGVTAEKLQISKKARLKHDADTPGKVKGDHAGHLIADKFGGSNKLDNIISQASNINQSAFRKIEIQWQNAIEAGKDVSVDIKVNYADDLAKRPSSFEVNFTIDGESFSENIKNVNPKK